MRKSYNRSRKRGGVPQAKAAGAVVRWARRRLGLTQEDLGKRLGIKSRAVSRWEIGTSGPSRQHRKELVTILGERDAAVGAELASAFARLYPKKLRKGQKPPPPPEPPRPPPNPSVLDRAVLHAADALDVAPRRARSFAIDILRGLLQSHLTVEEAIGELTRALPAFPS